jgi:hypothetical protein
MNNVTFRGYIFLVVLLLVGAVARADTQNVTISAQVNTGIGGGSGGGGGTSPTEVRFSGMGYPSSMIYIVKDGTVVATTVAAPNAQFSVTVADLAPGSYIFAVYGEDGDDRKSTSFSFPVFVTAGTSISIGGIFLSPTIDVDKIQVKQGEPIGIFGQSIPDAEVSIVVNSETQHIRRVSTDESGNYFLRFDSAVLEYGEHSTKSAAIEETDVSSFSDPAGFRVGTVTIPKTAAGCEALRGDLNCDSRVNLVDFSIMAFWYRRTGVPVKVDLNSDGTVTLIDFSIMAYHWTG